VAHDEDAAPAKDVAAPLDGPVASPPLADSQAGFRDRYLRRTRTTHLIYRTVVGIVGGLVIVLGVILLPLPGPGWLVIFAGLAILASEFTWAERLLDYARDKVLAWTHWVGRQPLGVRLSIGTACVVIVAAAVIAYLAVVGVPSWLPNGPEHWLDSWVP
jgi:uncharacterized protein (TIGR02611 family)